MIKNGGFLLALLFCPLLAFASGIRGTVSAEDGTLLGYATIYVAETSTGTTTNEEGYYELGLPAGTYEIVYQYLGYESQVRQVTVGEDYSEINIVLVPQATMLQTVTVKAGKEDPAYTIMRKAIAKATYHNNQLDSYTARVYIKGSGKLIDYPWLAKRALEKEGVEKNRVYISESISEVKYTRPDKFEETVISIHGDGKDNGTSPTPFIFGSFYQPEVAGVVSPLSPKAFAYYRFEYVGTFKDRTYDVSRIRVIPRSPGDDVIEGIINIVEDWWCIHSMEIKNTRAGINIHISSMYAPIEDKTWLPVSHRFLVKGKIFGFVFEYNYLASMSNYQIQLNPELYVESEQMEIVDEKLDKEHAREVQRAHTDTEKLQKRLEEGKEITRKELGKMLKEYEKNERKQLKEPEVMARFTYTIDSAAYTKDSAVWAAIRPVPLTKEEIIGYEKADSLAEIERKKEVGDTLKQSRHKGFQPWDLLLGDRYKLSSRASFEIHFPMGGFNTVEGFNLIYKLTYGLVFQDTNRTRFSITPTFRYAFAREKLSGHLQMNLRNKNYRLTVDGGRYVSQYNAGEPILPLVNTFTTLVLEQNWMKIYERDYVDVHYRRNLNPFITLHTNWSWMKRRELFNNSTYTLVNDSDIEEYMPNRPVNLELEDAGFSEHHAFIGSAGMTFRPWLKFNVRNGRKREIPNSSPTFTFEYRQGFDGIAGSEVSFSQIEVGVKHSLKRWLQGRLEYSLQGGMFLNNDRLYFMDYKHFMGNRTFLSTGEMVGSFRLLDYYLYSTRDPYFAASANYQFRKLLLTRIPLVRLAGVRENSFVNYLATSSSQHYTEAGYCIDGILRLFRLEAVVSFQNGQYLDHGFRIGITATLEDFSDN